MTFDYPLVDMITPDMAGLYRINNDAYHSGLGISSTRIKKALESHGHYTSTETRDSSALSFGRTFHMAVLEPHEYKSKYVVRPELSGFGHPNSNVYRAEKAKFEAANVGKEIIKRDIQDQINRMSESLWKHKRWEVIAQCPKEIMGITTCPETGLKLKCKMDIFGDCIYDIKTTSRNATKGDFKKDTLEYWYHISTAFYQDVIQYIFGGPRLRFVHIVIEKNPPHGTAFLELDQNIVEEGRVAWKAAAKRIVEWNGLGSVPPYGDGINAVSYDPRFGYLTKELLDSIT